MPSKRCFRLSIDLRRGVIDEALVNAYARWLATTREHEAVRMVVHGLQREADLKARLAVRGGATELAIREGELQGASAQLASEVARLPESLDVRRQLRVGGAAVALQETTESHSRAAIEEVAADALGDVRATRGRAAVTADISAGARAAATRFYTAEAREQAVATEVRLANKAVETLEDEHAAVRVEQRRLREAVRVVREAVPPSERIARQFLGHGVLAVVLALLCSFVLAGRAPERLAHLSGRARLALFAAAFAAGAGATWLSEAPAVSIYWTAFALGAAIVLPTLGMLAWQGRLDPLSPPVVFAAIVCGGYLLPLPSFLAGRDVISTLWPHTFSDFDAAVGRALRLAALAVIGFFLGYGVTPHVRGVVDRVPRLRVDETRLVVVGFGFVATASLLAMLLVVRIGGPGQLIAALADRTRAFAGMGYLVWGLMLPGIFCLFWWEHLLRQRRALHPWFLLLAPLAIALSAFTGSKANTFALLVAGVVVYHVVYRPLPWRLIVSAGVCGVFGLALFELLVRDVLVRGWSYGDRGVFEVVWGATQVALAGTFFQLQILSIVADVFPERVAPQWGSSFLFLLAAPIPSSIWPAKPLPLAGLFTMMLWPSRFVSEGTTIPASLLGEFYINFGWAGALLGMAAFGLGYRLLRTATTQRPDIPALPSLYGIAIALMLHYVRGEVAPVTVIAALLGIPVAAAAVFSVKRL